MASEMGIGWAEGVDIHAEVLRMTKGSRVCSHHGWNYRESGPGLSSL